MNTQEKATAEMEEITINTDVLVIGGGAAGVKAAEEVAGVGYKVVVIDSSDTIEADGKPGIEALPRTRLVKNVGIPGDFTVSLNTDGQVSQRKVGAVVVATDTHFESLSGEYGLSLSDSVVTQSQLEAALGSDSGTLANKTVAFVTGFVGESTPIALGRILNSALLLQKAGCQVYVYADNLKVAGDGLDRLYMEARDNGATYFKLQTKPDIVQNDTGLSITFTDPVLRKEMTLSPDFLVVEEAVTASDLNADLAEILRIHTGPQNLLQKDNVHLFPVRSNREGIFVVGDARKFQSPTYALADAENVALEVKALLDDGKKWVAADQAVVDRGKCVICLTCYRCCPHGAIYWDERAVISPVACQGCGICASECPQDAIQLGAFKDDDLRAAVKESAAASKDAPNIVAFCCQNSAFEASEMAADFKMPVPAGLRTIKVPCAGKIDIEFIMNAFIEGADGVLVMACHTGNCKSDQGNTYAQWRVADAHRMMTEAGFETDRLRFVTLASNMGNDFSTVTLEMEQQLRELGPSPLK